MFVFPVIPVLIAIVVYLVRRKRGAEPGPALRTAALAVAGVFVGFFGLFVVGETFTDPGGWVALGLVASWLVPLVALTVFASRRPDRAVPVLLTLTGLLLALGVWGAISPALGDFEDTHGPVRGIVAFALAVPVLALARQRPQLGGILLLVIGVVPGLLALIPIATGARVAGSVAILVVTSPMAFAGALMLVSAALEHRRPDGVPHEHSTHPVGGLHTA